MVASKRKANTVLVLSRTLSSAATPLVAYMVTNAAILSGGVENPLSLCNVLFVGNLCASLVVGVVHGFGPLLKAGMALSGMAKRAILLGGGFAALQAGLVYSALERTTVTNVVLLGRVGPVLYAIAGVFFLSQRISRREWVGFGFIGVGVVLTSLLTSGYTIQVGDLMVVASTFVYATAAVASKKIFKEGIDLSVLIFFRNIFSALIFFVLALYLFGPHHFSDAFSGDLWVTMLLYAAVVILGSQFGWFYAFRELSAAEIAKWSPLPLALGVLFAFLINGERPGWVQVVAFTIILIGVLVSSSAKWLPKTGNDSVEGSIAAS